ncbi:M6 family metalloprotease domain-containing protein [Streptomyces chilikensis]|uniref:M6 family metalloprotease domain-containing protein n=1 Tax=Streptomyces chilikensis TaxID=1194079 RepID=A0ABV3EM61_9ACTN
MPHRDAYRRSIPGDRAGRLSRSRRIASLAALCALGLAVCTSAVNEQAEDPTAAGPVPPARTAVGLAPCMINGGLGSQMSEGLPTPSGYSAATGTVRALNLMIDFPDARGEGDPMDRYGEFFPQTQDWFRTSSYGRLDYRPDAPVRRWLRMPKEFEEYGIERGAPFDPAYRGLVEDIVEEADPEVDFSRYDLLNVLVTPNAGPSALDTVLSVTFAANSDAPVADGVPVSHASFVYSRQDDGSGTYDRTGYRVLPHENAHVFGLPDLYTQDGGGAAGHWDIMSEDWGANNDLLGWHKWKLGWLDSGQVSCAARAGSVSDHVLTPLARAGGPKLVVVPLDADTSYAVEVRTQEGNDELVCRPGVLVYRVEAGVETGRGPVTVHDHRRDSGGCTHSPNVHAELSDATLTTGDTFADREHGVRVHVLGKGPGETYRLRVTRK